MTVSTRSMQPRWLSGIAARTSGACCAARRPSPCPDLYEYLEAEGFQYAIRLPANQVLQNRIAYLLTRPVGRPPHYVRWFYASFHYPAQSWSWPRRVVAKVEWHPGELHPRVSVIVTKPPASGPEGGHLLQLARHGGAVDQGGTYVVKWTRSRASRFGQTACASNSTPWRTTSRTSSAPLALPGEIAQWSLTTLREKVVKIGAKVVAR